MASPNGQMTQRDPASFFPTAPTVQKMFPSKTDNSYCISWELHHSSFDKINKKSNVKYSILFHIKFSRGYE